MKFIVKSKSNADFKKIIKLLPPKHREGYQYILEATIFYEKNRLLITHNETDNTSIYSHYFCDIDIRELTDKQKKDCNTVNQTRSFKVCPSLLYSICQYIEEYDLHFEITSDLLVLNFIAKPPPSIHKNKYPIQIDLFSDDLELIESIKQYTPSSFEVGISSFSFEKSAKSMISSFQLSAPVLCRHFENMSTTPTSSKKAESTNTIFNTDIVALEHCRVAESESRLILYTNDCRDICISSFKFTPALLSHGSFFITIKKVAIKKLASLLKRIEVVKVSLECISSEESNNWNTHYLTLSSGSISFSVDVKLQEKFKDSTKVLKKIIRAYSHNEQSYDVNKWNRFSIGNELYKSNAHAIQMNYNHLKKGPENNISIKYIYQEDLSHQASSILNTSIFSVMPFQSNCSFKLNSSLFHHATKTLSENESNDSLVKISSNEFDYDGVLLSSEVSNEFDEHFYFLVPFEA